MLPGLLLSATAAASTPVPEACGIASPTGSHPSNRAADVPLDVVPAVFFSQGGCGGDEWTFHLSGPNIAQTETVSTKRGIGQIVPVNHLSPGETYTLTLLPNDGTSGEAEFSFTTGADKTRPLSFVPELLELSAFGEVDSFVVEVDASARFGTLAGEDLAARWQDGPDEDVDVALFAPAAAGTTQSRAWATSTTEAEPAEWCARVGAREFDGGWALSETLCVPVELDGNAATDGCGDAGGSAAAGGLALGMLIAKRQRRACR